MSKNALCRSSRRTCANTDSFGKRRCRRTGTSWPPMKWPTCWHTCFHSKVCDHEDQTCDFAPAARGGRPLRASRTNIVHSPRSHCRRTAQLADVLGKLFRAAAQHAATDRHHEREESRVAVDLPGEFAPELLGDAAGRRLHHVCDTAAKRPRGARRRHRQGVLAVPL